MLKTPRKGKKKELPPHTRRILLVSTFACACSGTTSAHAENTLPGLWRAHLMWNYLRTRGEYPIKPARTRNILELPPHTRRIHASPRGVRHTIRTTSAHAENTHFLAWQTAAWRNYLRTRGEYSPTRTLAVPGWELPPHTRRIPCPWCGRPMYAGTTSAHAENTPTLANRRVLARNYLRTRGEYPANQAE